MMETDDFRNNNIDTAWLDKRIKDAPTPVRNHAGLVVLVGSAVQVYAAAAKARAEFTAALGRGQFPDQGLLKTQHNLDIILDGVKYQVAAALHGPSSLILTVNDTTVVAKVTSLSDGGYTVRLDESSLSADASAALVGGVSHNVYTHVDATGFRLELDGATFLFEDEYDPTRLCAEMAGKLARWLVEDGSAVAKGEPYAEVEVMKMFLALRAPEAGKVHIQLSEGTVLEAGDLLATMELDDPSMVQKAELFTSSWSLGDLYPAMNALAAASTPTEGAIQLRPQYRLRRALALLNRVLQGFEVPEPVVSKALRMVIDSAQSPLIARCEIGEILSTLNGRLPAPLAKELGDLKNSLPKTEARTGAYADAAAYAAAAASAATAMKSVPEILARHLQAQPEREQNALAQKLVPLNDVVAKYAHSLGRYGVEVVALLSSFVANELPFGAGVEEDVVRDLRRSGADDLDVVTSQIFAHVSGRNSRAGNSHGLLVALLGQPEMKALVQANPGEFILFTTVTTFCANPANDLTCPPSYIIIM